jgi:hypothetical protein
MTQAQPRYLIFFPSVAWCSVNYRSLFHLPFVLSAYIEYNFVMQIAANRGSISRYLIYVFLFIFHMICYYFAYYQIIVEYAKFNICHQPLQIKFRWSLVSNVGIE